MLDLIVSLPQWALYLIFGSIILLFLVLDLGIFNRKAKVMSGRAALVQSMFWIAISLFFGVLIYYNSGDTESALTFFTAYVTEKALSFDNIFVMLLILRYFNVKKQYYHRILTWGILGALILRGIFIFLGFYLIDLFHGVHYIFAGFLIYSGIMLFFDKGEASIDPEKNLVYRFAKKFLPLKDGDHQGKFFVRENGKLLITPLFLVLLLVESSDMFFAADSIPAAFAISDSRFIIFTSNIFAVLGLRALFFLLSSVIDKFYLLQKGLSFILVFIGVKMFIGMLGFGLPTFITFSVILFCLFSSIMTSLIIPAPARTPVEKNPAQKQKIISNSQKVDIK